MQGGQDQTEGINYGAEQERLFGILTKARETRNHSFALWCCGEFWQAVGYYGKGVRHDLR